MGICHITQAGRVTHGPFSGECGVNGSSIVIWARAAAPGGNFVAIVSDDEGNAVAEQETAALLDNDYTMKFVLHGLPAGQSFTARVGEKECSFQTNKAKTEKMSFVFSSCLGGQS